MAFFTGGLLERSTGWGGRANWRWDWPGGRGGGVGNRLVGDVRAAT